MSRQRSCYALLRRIVLSSLLLLGAASTAFAQFDRGTISGPVKDAQGGIVPGATVTVTSTATQQSNSTVTDGSGYYTFPNLSAGRYELVVELSGFKKIQVAPTSSWMRPTHSPSTSHSRPARSPRK